MFSLSTYRCYKRTAFDIHADSFAPGVTYLLLVRVKSARLNFLLCLIAILSYSAATVLLDPGLCSFHYFMTCCNYY